MFDAKEIKRFDVIGYEGQSLGIAKSYGEVKKLHLSNMPEDLQEFYAGIDLSYKGSGSFCRPAYHEQEGCSEMMVKYDIRHFM